MLYLPLNGLRHLVCTYLGSGDETSPPRGTRGRLMSWLPLLLLSLRTASTQYAIPSVRRAARRTA
jgi:hypothetical protein